MRGVYDVYADRRGESRPVRSRTPTPATGGLLSTLLLLGGFALFGWALLDAAAVVFGQWEGVLVGDAFVLDGGRFAVAGVAALSAAGVVLLGCLAYAFHVLRRRR